MDLLQSLPPGLRGEAELVVGEEHSAARVGSGRARVLATPTLVALFEAAAVAAVEARLPPGQQSVGTRLDVRHVAATPLGMRVRAEAELIAVAGRTLRFRVWARDEHEPIGEGEHDRAVVDGARFQSRVDGKAAR